MILGDHVTTDSGTGIVHTAPGFGEDDYNVGIANGLEVAVTVNERGIMMANAGPEFEGQFYDKVVPTVIEKLGDLLLAQEEISHSTHLTGVQKTNYLACGTTMVCLSFKIPSRNLGRN